jgi:hypothetical protein
MNSNQIDFKINTFWEQFYKELNKIPVKNNKKNINNKNGKILEIATSGSYLFNINRS